MHRIFAVFCLSLSVPAAGQAARTFPILRAGQPVVCADLNDGDQDLREVMRQWIIGFWSGMNVGERAQAGSVGRNTSASGVFGEIALFCKSHPSMLIDQATFAVRERMRKAGN
ncbi:MULTISPECIES: hypothetical protein [unclassified Sphingomonas]|uniref:hypothetical protein n=1 Tax=unclassified Sphingomonas TaxID=196159 RepID=UPI0006F7E0CC|nr:MULTISPECIES: hypothetical protein [unclassified Sphingomonas]KQM57299.1 hypothetical protein ASE65_13360 [Sphingomonas sp. Leaf16]KQN10474.1 hypothetical protein ASE81_13405 [Sphingomonas sp. Leaf29]KQN18275.1 hypothetical protein ASE83_13340 [Sphingomonas sp. Leaf32]